MIQGKWFAPGDDISPILPIRQDVFHRGSDDLDNVCWNAMICEDDIPIASGRIWYQEGAFWLGDIGVLLPFRGKRFGDLTLRILLFKAQSHYAREVRLHCPSETAGFFTRLGFSAVSSKGGMTEMQIQGDQIKLDSCDKCPQQNCPKRQ